MLPLTLKLKGVFSYKEEQTIDFRTLTSSRIFGIFGVTGSGKSSIIDAMIYALYGKLPRLNNREIKEIFNLNSDELLIDFEFEQNEKYYKVTVFSNRTSKGKNKGETKQIIRKFFDIGSGNESELETEKIPEIIGLNFEDFTKTIIIPQGYFKEFLELDGPQKKEMFKRIFNLEKFDLKFKIAKVQKDIRQKIDINTGNLKAFENLDLSRLEPLKLEIEELKFRAEKLKNENLTNRENEKEFSKLKELFDNLKKQEDTVQKLKLKEPEYKAKESEISEFEECREQFKNLIDNVNEKNEKFKASSIILKEKQIEYEENNKKLLDFQVKFAQTQKDYENKSEKAQEKLELEHILNINKDAIEIEKLNKKRIELDAEFKQVSELIIKKEEELKQLKFQEEASDKEAEKYQHLNDISLWFESKKSFVKMLENNNLQKIVAEKELNNNQKEFEALYSEMKNTFDIVDIHQDNFIQICQALQNKFNIEKEELSAGKDEINWKSKLKEFSEKLSEGSPCPLCGATHHPQPLVVEHNKKLLAEITNKIKIIENNEKLITKLNSSFANLSKEKNRIDGNVKNIEMNIKKAEEEMNEHIKKFTWKEYNYNDEERIESEKKRSKELLDEIKKDKKKIDEINLILEANKNKKKLYDENVHKNDMQRSQTEGRRNSLLNQLKTSDENLFKLTEEQIKEQIAELDKFLSTIDAKYQKEVESMERGKAKVQNLYGEISYATENLKNLQTELENKQNVLSADIAKSKYQNENEIISILKKKLDVEKIKTGIKNFYAELSASDELLKNIQNSIGENKYNSSEHNSILSVIKENENLIEKNNNESGQKERELKEIECGKNRKKELEAEQKKLEQRAEYIDIIEKLFKSDGFISFLSRSHLQNLVKIANLHFTKMTSNQLELELDKENNFLVRDLLNEGKLRHIKTLSGGQTFQASLCLAISLSDIITSTIHSNENLFFLDEGFGNLDTNSLQIVLDTLQNLRKENRIVGIITHVEDMKQIVDNYIETKLDAEHGTQIFAG